MKKLSSILILFALLLTIGCGTLRQGYPGVEKIEADTVSSPTDSMTSEELMALAEQSKAQIITYPLNTSPVIADQLLGMDDPDGSWAVNRYAISTIFDFFLSNGFTSDYFVYDDILSCLGEQSDFCFVYDELTSDQLELRTNNPQDMTFDMQNAGAGDFVLKVNGYKALTEENTVNVDGRGNVFVTGLDTPSLAYGRQTAIYAASQTLTLLECRGYTIYMNGAGTLTLNSIALGHEVWVYTEGAVAVSVAPNALDKIWLDGVALDDGDKITNTSTAGDWAHFTYHGADGWWARTNEKNWTDGGPASGATNYALDANCMGAWRMNSSGNETDISGEGGDLFVDGGTIPTSVTVPSGYSGTSRDFEADDTEFLYHADGLSTDISGANQSMSICAWIKAESSGNNVSVVQKYTATDNNRQYRLRTEGGDGSMKFFLSSDGTSFVTATGTTNVTGGDWFDVCAVYDDTDIRIYVDGALDSNGADNPKAYTGGIYNGDGIFSIGAAGDDGTQYFDGRIDQVDIFDRGLSAAEVLDHYNDGMEGEKGGND